MLAAALACHRDAIADLHRLDGVDAHHRGRDIGIELVEYRLAQARGHAFRAHRDARADRLAGGTYVPDQLLELGYSLRVGTEERVVVGRTGLERRQCQCADLAQVAIDAYRQALGQVFACDRPSRHSHHGLARRGAAATAMIAQAVFLLVGIVGVSGAETISQAVIVARAGVAVLDQQSDWRAGGAPFEHAGQYPHLVGFAPLTHELRAAGATPVDVTLQIGRFQRQSRGTAVDDAAQCRPVALAEAGDREQSAYGVARHSLVRHFRCNSCSRSITNTPPPPRSNASQIKGSRGEGRCRARSGLPTSTIRIPPGLRCAAASRKIILAESSPSSPAASANRGSCRYSAGSRVSWRRAT